MAAIVRSYMMYKPYVLFAWLTAVFGVLGLIPFVRYGVLWIRDREDGHLQSLLVGALLLILAFMSLMLGVISDLIRTNRDPDRGQSRAHQTRSLRGAPAGCGCIDGWAIRRRN